METQWPCQRTPKKLQGKIGRTLGLIAFCFFPRKETYFLLERLRAHSVAHGVKIAEQYLMERGLKKPSDAAGSGTRKRLLKQQDVQWMTGTVEWLGAAPDADDPFSGAACSEWRGAKGSSMRGCPQKNTTSAAAIAGDGKAFRPRLLCLHMLLLLNFCSEKILGSKGCFSSWCFSCCYKDS